MKLNPEELEIVSFETDQLSAYQQVGTIADTVIDTNNPTPATYCFVCD